MTDAKPQSGAAAGKLETLLKLSALYPEFRARMLSEPQRIFDALELPAPGGLPVVTYDTPEGHAGLALPPFGLMVRHAAHPEMTDEQRKLENLLELSIIDTDFRRHLLHEPNAVFAAMELATPGGLPLAVFDTPGGMYGIALPAPAWQSRELETERRQAACGEP